MLKAVLTSKSVMLYLILLPIITLISIGMGSYFKYSIDEIEANIISKDVANAHEVALKLSGHILHRSNNRVLETLSHDEPLRLHLEDELSLQLSSQYTYLYLLYFDKEGKLRYLLDSSEDPEQRGEFRQRFGLHDPLWEKAQQSGQPQVISQQDITGLWSTYLYPIKANGEEQVQGILAIDFSYDDYAAILKAIRPMQTFFAYFSGFLLFVLLITYLQLYLIYRSRKKSIIDPLTSVYNRVYMNEVLPSLNLQKYALCMLDIDHFKQINDNYGHNAGDTVLREMANRIKQAIGNKDLFFRYGGEEFMLLLHSLNDNQIEATVNRLRCHIKATPIAIDSEQRVTITLSIGCNTRPNESRNLNQAIELADQQLYRAKEQGRDRAILI